MTTVDVMTAQSRRESVVRFAGFVKILAEETRLAISSWRRQAREARAIRQLNDHLLFDIGVNPADARNPLVQDSKPGFWQHLGSAWKAAQVRRETGFADMPAMEPVAANDSSAKLHLPHAA